jgi:hypothetical protein
MQLSAARRLLENSGKESGRGNNSAGQLGSDVAELDPLRLSAKPVTVHFRQYEGNQLHLGSR